MHKPYIEQDCTITHEGRSFTAGGAVVTDNFITAYVGKASRTDLLTNARGWERPLTDWHGNRIGACKITSSWPIYGKHGRTGDDMHQIYATVDSKLYTGRGMGEGMCCNLRRVKGK